MARDIQKIAKLEHLVPALQAEIDRDTAHLDAWADKFREDPFYWLGRTDSVCKRAADMKVAKTLHWVFNAALQKPDELVEDSVFHSRREVTIEQIATYARARVGELASCATSDGRLMERYELEAWINIQRGSYFGSGVSDAFYKAQEKDPEYVADVDRRCAAAKAKREADEAELAARKKVAEKARARANKAIRENKTPADEDLLAGWPDKSQWRGPEIDALIKAAEARQGPAQPTI